MQSEGIRSVKMKTARQLWGNDPSARKLSVKELADKFNNNPNQAYTPATPGMIRQFKTEYKKRTETEPASNQRSLLKGQTNKKRKK
jgi:hypothetical protein